MLLTIEQVRDVVSWASDGQLPKETNYRTLTDALNFCIVTGGSYIPYGLRVKQPLFNYWEKIRLEKSNQIESLRQKFNKVNPNNDLNDWAILEHILRSELAGIEP